MGRSWWTRFGVVLFFTLLSVVYVTPTLFGLNPETTKFPFKQKVNLGLDLQGGLYLVLGVDFNKVWKDVASRQVTSLRDTLTDKGVVVKSVGLKTEGGVADDPRLEVTFDGDLKEKIEKIRKESFWTLRLTGDEKGRLEYGLSSEYRQEVRDRTVNQSIEVIRNRIDEFGVAEPVIASQGTDRIVVELPGVRDVQRAKDLIGRTAKLEFRIVNDEALDPVKLGELVAQIEKEKNLVFKEGETKFSDYVRQLNEGARGKIPDGTEIAFERVSAGAGAPAAAAGASRIPYLLFAKADVTGDDLQDAQVSFDQETGQPHVSFTLNPRGADLFDKLTAEHIRDRLAIVLDGIVHSAPVIQSRIGGGRGQITLGSGNADQMMNEAKDLAIVLRAGALPAQLDFLEQRVTGPSLGQDSIKKGAMAAVIGSLGVFLFVLFYYRVSGVIAVISLLLNVLFVVASLVGLEATLTLPGIAGIALTVGIAVDSNVVIYERIREEIRAGKVAIAAVEAGFQKAFRTILDANITNAAAAIVLLEFGTGPIKGFAVTLLIGIVATVFTAVFVCKMMFDAYLKRLERTPQAQISI
jgi:preprotein translocase subunit SecD